MSISKIKSSLVAAGLSDLVSSFLLPVAAVLDATTGAPPVSFAGLYLSTLPTAMVRPSSRRVKRPS